MVAVVDGGVAARAAPRAECAVMERRSRSVGRMTR
jgi:hypothetical protein